MAKIQIQYVGPIKEGIGKKDFLNLDGLTVFIGSQGSGKSTVAKLTSTLTWIEKSLVREDFSVKQLTNAGYDRFAKMLEYQGIRDYLEDKSYISYEGDAYKLTYQNGEIIAEVKEQTSSYRFPKIMYVPAERNFVGSVDRPDQIKGLPSPLFDFLAEYEKAKEALGVEVELPIGKTTFIYQKKGKKSYLQGEGFQVNLLNASSGFQSAVPLVLVTRYLSELIKNPESSGIHQNSLESEIKLARELREKIDKELKSGTISDYLMERLYESVRNRFTYSGFVNVVEEPEQNLYPTSQREILFDLIKNLKENPFNRLILTTHSPYIINYLTLVIKAYQILQEIQKTNGQKQKFSEMLGQVVPIEAAISTDLVNIYQINNDGSIERLPEYEGIPSDSNFLNHFLGQSNELFDKLLDIEEIL